MTDVLIYGPIGMGWGKTAEEVRAELAEADGDVMVLINSAGGSFDEGPAIYNTLMNYKGGIVTTEVDGIAYSMASVILQAGTIRRMASNSVLMVHGAQYSVEGSAEDMRKTAEMMDVHTEAMVSAFTTRGIDEKTVRGWLEDGEDHFFTAEQALAANLIDEISDAIDMATAIKAIPADISLPPALAAYRNPQREVMTMPDNTAEEHAPDNQAKIDIPAFKADRERNIKHGRQVGQQAEMKRQNAIRAFFSRPQFSDPDRIGENNVKAFRDLQDACLADFNVTVDAARDAALDLQDGMPSPILSVETLTQSEDSVYSGRTARPPQVGGLHVDRGFISIADQKDKYVEGVTEAFTVKAGLENDKEKLAKAQRNEYLGMSTFEMARRYLDINNIKASGVRREQIIGQALVTADGIAHSTSDFSNILENIANKAMMMGWDEAGESWQRWARTGTLPDFKQGSRVNLSTFGDLEIIHENGEYKYGTFSDLKEPLQLVTFGKMFGVSRQALASDDLSALGQIPRSMGRAAARKIGDLAYNVLTSNPVLNQDSTEVFHANHNNIGTPGAPSITTLDEARTSMALQTDPAGNTLNIRGQHLIVPVALETAAATLLAAQYDPAGTAGTLKPNPFQNSYSLTSDARLDTDSATQWYLLASGTMHDTVEVAFLNGQQTPYLDAQDGWRVDGVEYKVRIDAVAVPLDFRTMFRNAGA